MKRFKYNEETHRRNSNYLLLLLFFLSLLFFPIFSVFFRDFSDLVFRLSASVIILWGAYVVTDTKKELFIAWILAFLAVFGFWLEVSSLLSSQSVIIFRTITGIIYFGYLGQRIAVQLIENNDQVSLNLVYGAIIVFFIIGIIGGDLCTLLDIVEPGTFFLREGNISTYNYYYFSFVTLTSIGYGDFTPNNESGRALALLIGLFGQVYLTIVIAIIIGKYLNQERVGRE